MKHLLLVALLAAHAAAYWLWCRFVTGEVARNAADILADGSADTLRKGYHSRRAWARFWPWLGLSVAANLSMLLSKPISLPAVLIGCLSLGVLLAGYFARFFTPMLNVARRLPEFHASSDSASWPDAAAYKEARAYYADNPDTLLLRLRADMLLRRLLTRTWLAARLLYAAGTLVTIAAFLHY